MQTAPNDNEEESERETAKTKGKFSYARMMETEDERHSVREKKNDWGGELNGLHVENLLALTLHASKNVVYSNNK